MANPECREVADKAHATLLRVGAKGKVTTQTDEEKAAEAKVPTVSPLFNGEKHPNTKESWNCQGLNHSPWLYHRTAILKVFLWARWK